MTLFSMLTKEQKQNLQRQIRLLMTVNDMAVASCFRMMEPYQKQNRELQAFLDDERTLDQIHNVIKRGLPRIAAQEDDKK